MGFIVNVRNCMRAPVTANTSSSYVIGTPVAMPNLRQIDMTFTSASGELYGDGKKVSAISKVTGATVKLDIDKLTSADKAFFGGHTLSNKGILSVKSSDVPTLCAIYVEAEHDDGGYEATWFLCGKAQPFNWSAQQSESNVTYSTPSLTFDFIPRTKDDEVIKQGDTDDESFTTTNQEAFRESPDI